MAGDIEVDYSQLEAFSKRMAVMANGGFEQKVATAVQQAGQSYITAIKAKTPVAKTKGGTLRRGWKLKKVGYTGSFFTITIANNTDYASFVESGHRTRPRKAIKKGEKSTVHWVEGQFMMRDGVKEAEPTAVKIIHNRVEKALNEVFGGK